MPESFELTGINMVDLLGLACIRIIMIAESWQVMMYLIEYAGFESINLAKFIDFTIFDDFAAIINYFITEV